VTIAIDPAAPRAVRTQLHADPTEPSHDHRVVDSDPAGLGTDPSVSFAELGVSPAVIKVLGQRSIHHPTAVQIACIPDALDGRDVSGKAPTGSGKTVAFGVPLATRLERGRPGHPRGLVLVPTRELATQVAAELTPLLAVHRRRLATFFGGVGFGPQIKALRSGVDLAVACPGRLEDLQRSGHLALDGVDLVVVDEADRMADMGFLPALRRILDATSPKRQTLLFSATLDGAVDAIVRQYQDAPVRHEVAATDDDLDRMTHRFEAVEAADRVAACADVVNQATTSVVFVRTRHGADRLAKQLSRLGIESAAIHGDRSQPQRQRALDAFRAGSVRALVATDVAARGIHVDDVACVVHFDMPADATDYVHRSGRTARAGATGSVVSLVTRDQHADVHRIVRTLDLDADLVGITPAKAGASRTQSGTGGGRRGPAGRSARPAGRSRSRQSFGATRNAGDGATGGTRNPAGAGRETGGTGRSANGDRSGHFGSSQTGRAKNAARWGRGNPSARGSR